MPDQLGFFREVVDDRSRFASRGDIGDTIGLVSRMLRYFTGNPIRNTQVASANSATPVPLPNEARAMSATCQVLGAPIIYRPDGTVPTPALDQTLPVGTIITLTGIESITGFVFAAAGATLATLAVNYYD